MLNLKRLCGINAILVSISFASMADEFKAMYKDSENLEWSQKLDGLRAHCVPGGSNFTCLNPQDDLAKSPAQIACRELGGRLPTVEEYEVLAADLGSYGEFRRVFTDDEPFLSGMGYWTANVSSKDRNYAFRFSSYWFDFSLNGRAAPDERFGSYVRCVRE